MTRANWRAGKSFWANGRPGKRFWLAAGFLGLLAGGVATWVEKQTAWMPPQPDEVHDTYRSSDGLVLAHDGRVLHELRTDPQRRALPWTPLPSISAALVKAVLHSEDRRFFEHDGIDLLALAAAAWQRLHDNSPRGASTISMQLAALLDDRLRPSNGGRRSWGEKFQQMRAAGALESSWRKDEILEAYLNLVPFRGEVVGVSAAAGALLGKDPHGIDGAEAALLAALLRAPSAPRKLVERRARDLLRRTAPWVDGKQIAGAAKQIFATPNQRGPRPRLAAHLARRLFARRPSATTIRSTVDLDLQRAAQRILEEELASVRSRNVRDGAVVVLHNETGAVLAYVGNSGSHATAGYVDGVRARRQAGSTLKPFLYALAIERKLLTAASLLDDSPLEVPVGGAVYRPRNYDDRFRGQTTLRTALASSLNVPAVRTQRLIGEPAFVSHLTQLGFRGVVQTGDHYGPSLTLGTAGVDLLELANAYRTLARDGLYSPPHMVAALPPPSAPTPIYNPATAFILGQILSDREARSATFGLENALATPFWTAVKTGTSKEMRDNWCVGFSSEFTIAVWVGNYSGEPMHDVSGVTGAAPTWLRLISLLHREHPGHLPVPPPGTVARRVAFPDGDTRREWFLTGTEPPSARVVPASPAPTILSPSEGSILAIDPEIPSDHQKVALIASGNQEPLVWHLDDHNLGSVAETILWSPRAGRHVLRLVDSDGAVVDRVGFTVKGDASGRDNCPPEAQKDPELPDAPPRRSDC